MELSVATILHQMADEGYPITDQRRAMVELVMSQPRRFTADDLIAQAKERGLRIGRATIFRSLDLLARLNYLCRVQDENGRAYALCSPVHHHHLVCSQCGQVLHIEGCPVDEYLTQLQSSTGYRVAAHRLDIAGVCPACQTAASDRA